MDRQKALSRPWRGRPCVGVFGGCNVPAGGGGATGEARCGRTTRAGLVPRRRISRRLARPVLRLAKRASKREDASLLTRNL